MTPRYVRSFAEIGLSDLPLVGGKNAALGELVRSLAPLGVPVPPGFAITAEAYRALVARAGLEPKLRALFRGVVKADLAMLADRAAQARALIVEAGIPEDIWLQIEAAWRTLEAEGVAEVAVRSSATAEDLPNASFAGQQESFLNVRGPEALRDACIRCFASLFTERAVSYRIDNGFDHLAVALSIGVQKMVRSDIGASGVIFTIDTESGFRDVVLVTAAYGLGENVVQGTVDPDEYYVFKPTLRAGKRAIVRKRLGSKHLRMEYEGGGTRNVPIEAGDRRRFAIPDAKVLELARHALAIEDHWSKRAGRPAPMDIEWAMDGRDGSLYIVQARPETVLSQRRERDVTEVHVLEKRGKVLATGKSVGQRIATGIARVVASPERLQDFPRGGILVAETTTPDWEPIMKIASGIVTSHGGRTCHAAILARELGVPAIVGAEGATKNIPDGAEVTVSCAEGDNGFVYQGALPHHVDKLEVSTLRRPRTKIMMNVGDPSRAFSLASIPCDGVGLARLEFIIGNTIQAHPMALLHPERVTDPAVRAKLAELTAGYPDGPEYFVDRLAQGVGTIAAAFYPKPVIVRLSDFKSNEYAKLVGGEPFEPHEENPMIGLRGAARYTHPSYAEAFVLECRAMRRVREEMGLTNVKLMIPFCRRVVEGERVMAALAREGLVRGNDGLEVYVMCEIPNNVIQIDAFCRIFDGISIGSNDLTQLTLGVDRDSPLVAEDFDERDPGVLASIRMAVQGAQRNGAHSGICGQAPSDHADFAEMLVRLGIDSISLTPDTVLLTTARVLATEEAIAANPEDARLSVT
ncbi:MAG: phosphoenolpyruvate synthase [Polyangiales bacterium]